MLQTLFIHKDGRVLDDGSLSSGGNCYLRRGDEGFYPVGIIHGRQVFVSITDDQWHAIREAVIARGGTWVGVSTASA